MSQIIDSIYVGSLEDSFDDNVLDKVTHILNVAEEVNIRNRLHHKYQKYGVNDDDLTEDITRIIPDCMTWINNAVNNEKGIVLIHCLEGKSRSVIIVIAYLCYKGYDIDEAISLIKCKRPCHDIFSLYMEQLRNFVKLLKLKT